MNNPPTGADGQHVTFCRLCEAFCGMIATVKDGRVVDVQPDHDNPKSRGHVCVKGMNSPGITYDPDRVTTPLKRTGDPGSFSPVSWNEALDDIAKRLVDIRARHGDAAIASFLGNPASYSTNAFGGFYPFMRKIGSFKHYASGSQDNNARFTANYILHGSPWLIGLNDFENCDHLLIIGGNPLVSNGWMMSSPRIRHELDAIAARGKVIIVDPCKTETAQRYEHLSIRPDTDVWLLLGMLRVLIDEQRIDEAMVEEITVGWLELKNRIASVSVSEAAMRTGIDEQKIVSLARDFSDARCGAIYGGLGVCRGEFGTMGSFLLSVLNVVTGRYGAQGGVVFTREALPTPNNHEVGGYGETATRIGGVPSIASFQAAAMMPADIEEDGEGQVRAVVLIGGNPALSAPGGAHFVRAFEKLDLLLSFDVYVSESNLYADYILPGLSQFEREDWPLFSFYVNRYPFLQYTDPVIAPIGDCRDEYGVMIEILRRMGLLDENGGDPELDPEKSPVAQLDGALRSGPVGDHHGEREGWSLERLRQHPHGVMVDDMPGGGPAWRQRISYPDERVRLWHNLVASELYRVFAHRPRTETLRLIGRRDIRSVNSWLHNVDRLVRSQEPRLLINPDDAAAHLLKSGDRARLISDFGSAEVDVEVTNNMSAGAVCYPHGWGHAGGWQRANRTTGGNVNQLHGVGVEAVEFVSGMSLIDCLPVRVEKIDQADQA